MSKSGDKLILKSSNKCFFALLVSNTKNKKYYSLIPAGDS